MCSEEEANMFVAVDVDQEILSYLKDPETDATWGRHLLPLGGWSVFVISIPVH